MTVKHLLEQKGRSLWTIDPDATVLDAVAKMAEKDIGSLVVMDGEELIGARRQKSDWHYLHRRFAQGYNF
jgi:CBS domain-containing protein